MLATKIGIVVLGGKTSLTGSNNTAASQIASSITILKYDGALTVSSVPVTPPTVSGAINPLTLSAAACAYDSQTNTIHCFGGTTSTADGGQTYTNQFSSLNLDSMQWTATTFPQLRPRAYASAAIVQSRFYLLGGYATSNSTKTKTAVSEALVFPLTTQPLQFVNITLNYYRTRTIIPYESAFFAASNYHITQIEGFVLDTAGGEIIDLLSSSVDSKANDTVINMMGFIDNEDILSQGGWYRGRAYTYHAGTQTMLVYGGTGNCISCTLSAVGIPYVSEWYHVLLASVGRWGSFNHYDRGLPWAPGPKAYSQMVTVGNYSVLHGGFGHPNITDAVDPNFYFFDWNRLYWVSSAELRRNGTGIANVTFDYGDGRW
ncbi:hypothetical protein HDV00_004136 [Rhizophlyctis rosea]|nr:hypothetical protein HDV00_004136 [Rhizophlyctis rosea]